MTSIYFVGTGTIGTDCYPHLNDIFNILSEQTSVAFISVKERGLSLNESSWKVGNSRAAKIWNSFAGLISLIKTVVSSGLAIRREINQQKDATIVCIDNFIFCIASIFCRNKCILWSFDFVGDGNPHNSSQLQKIIRNLTALNLSRHRALIIQDVERERDLFSALRLESSGLINTYYLPVCLDQMIASSKGIAPVRPLKLLQMGGINSFRSGSDKLIKQYVRDYPHYKLVLHGFISPEINTLLGSVSVLPVISTTIYPPSQLSKLVAKADIGFIHYEVCDQNFRHLRNASNQLVEFLRCGKPVIVSGNSDLAEFVLSNNIGLALTSFEDIPELVSKIENNYNFFSCNASRVYSANYNARSHKNSLLNFIYTTKS